MVPTRLCIAKIPLPKMSTMSASWDGVRRPDTGGPTVRNCANQSVVRDYPDSMMRLTVPPKRQQMALETG
jgi:hypothetical protein